MTSMTNNQITTKRLGLRSAIAAALALVAVAASLALASPASAGLGVEAHASCQPGYILAHPPTMTAVTNQLIINGTIISSPLQPVGYKAHLFRLTSNGWAHVMSGPLMKQSVRTFAGGPDGLVRHRLEAIGAGMDEVPDPVRRHAPDRGRVLLVHVPRHQHRLRLRL